MNNQIDAAELIHFPAQKKDDIQFVHIIETFITFMQKHDIAICFTGNESNRIHSTEALASEISQHLHGTSMTSARISSLLNHYITLPYEVVKWKEVGRFPEVGNAMNEILSKTIDDVVDAANAGKISRDRALGVVNGTTSLLYQTGAISLLLTQEINDEVKKRIKKKFFSI
ncbi:hypothetical protein ACO0K2_05955 [Undibacterium sp. MH2W]|uniref:hypothetical protein n=1 Tax=Undibacterium sp. MH2W TaxID=3413044 RepID=UPI003BF3C30B